MTQFPIPLLVIFQLQTALTQFSLNWWQPLRGIFVVKYAIMIVDVTKALWIGELNCSPIELLSKMFLLSYKEYFAVLLPVIRTFTLSNLINVYYHKVS